MSTSIDLEGISISKPQEISKLKGLVDIVFLNEDELYKATGESSITSGINKLAKILRPKYLFLKMGANGSLVFINGKIIKEKAFRVRVVDSTGAGDGFNAAIIYGLLKKLSINSILLLGNAMGAYACTGFGARHYPRNIQELISYFPVLKEYLK